MGQQPSGSLSVARAELMGRDIAKKNLEKITHWILMYLSEKHLLLHLGSHWPEQVTRPL